MIFAKILVFEVSVYYRGVRLLVDLGEYFYCTRPIGLARLGIRLPSLFEKEEKKNQTKKHLYSSRKTARVIVRYSLVSEKDNFLSQLVRRYGHPSICFPSKILTVPRAGARRSACRNKESQSQSQSPKKTPRGKGGGGCENDLEPRIRKAML